MGKRCNLLNEAQITVSKAQKLFFIESAGPEDKTNISPKGMDLLRILNSNKSIWLNVIGNENDIAAYWLLNDHMTPMFCAFEEKSSILPLYGNAKIYHERDAGFSAFSFMFKSLTEARKIIEMDVDLVQNFGGMAVPFFEFNSKKTHLNDSATKQRKEKLKTYQLEKNILSIDGFETKITQN